MDKFQGYDMTLHERFLTKLEKVMNTGVSQAEIARQIGISSSAVSMYKNGNYDGAISVIEDKVKSWLDFQERKTSRLTIPYCEVGVTNVIYKAIDTAQRDKDFSVIIGKAGTSKTETIKQYVADNKMSMHITLHKITVGALLRAIAKQIKIDTGGGAISLYEKIVAYFQGKDWVIIVDEADYLNERCFQMLRHISDDAGIGIVLCGLERLEGILVSSRDEYQQLLRRVGTFLDLSEPKWKYSLNDAGVILKSVWSDIPHELVKEFYSRSKGSIGTLTKLMNKAHEVAGINSRLIPEHTDVDESQRVVMRAFSRHVM